MTLRIIAPSADPTMRRRVDAGRSGMDSYLERLGKLVPVEALSVYPLLYHQAMTLRSPNSDPLNPAAWSEVLVAWLVMLIVIVLRWHATSIPGRGPQWAAIGIAAVSFFIWVHAINQGDFGILSLMERNGLVTLYDQSLPIQEQVKQKQDAIRFVATLALVTWTILAPVFYRGDE